MFSRVSEKRAHFLRWFLVICWILLIASLFYDPVSSYLTEPQNQWSPLHITTECVVIFQGECLRDQPYSLGTTIFWGLVIPSAVMLLLIFGHETWRRICPLSFLSQIPRALGFQRKRKIVNNRTGRVRYELAKVARDSWLGRNHLYLQFGLLCLGLVLRILFLNSERLLLGSFLILTIFAAITVGYLFAGKSWCHYFCPMAPVQMVYNGPRSLLGSQAHQDKNRKITQSMCRTIDSKGKERSACIGCQSPCIDIDAERSYWEEQNKPGRKFVQYGYLGLVAGFYLYYWLYSGTLNYYYSGIWTHEENQLAKLFAPGFYLNGHLIAIPKIIAVPLTLGLFVGVSYFLLRWLEKTYKAHLIRKKQLVKQEQIQHRIFSLCTFIVFNIYFLFGGRPILQLFPEIVELVFNAFVILVSSLWLYKTWGRNAQTYRKESFAHSLRRQLQKIPVDFSKFLDGRAIADLNPDEVHVLAKILPSFNQEKSLKVYKGLLQELLEQGNVDSASSMEVLGKIRQELEITEEEHFAVLTELGTEHPSLLYPLKQHSLEDQLRLEGYRQALEPQILELLAKGFTLEQAVKNIKRHIDILNQDYTITFEEKQQILEEIWLSWISSSSGQWSSPRFETSDVY
ncbi:MAG: 4Fe-4S binding protein [Cyanobacteria bacterium P01_F01_bin.143]